MTSLKINRLLPIFIKVLCHWSLELIFKATLKLESGNQKIQYAARRPFWKWCCLKSIGFCLWPPSTCIWNLKLKFQSKLDLCSGNHVVYRQTDGWTDGRTDRWTDGKGESSIPPSNFVGRGYKTNLFIAQSLYNFCSNEHHAASMGFTHILRKWQFTNTTYLTFMKNFGVNCKGIGKNLLL